MEELEDRLAPTGLQVTALAGGYSLATREEYADLIRAFLAPPAEQLSKQALETLAIVAYKQPLTRAEIEAIRGVNSSGVLRSLMEKRLLVSAGRADAPGRPYLFETTPEFLSLFGLASLEDLPPLSEELAEIMALSLETAGAAEEEPPEEDEPFTFEA
jgi:segregation and condensation protein B